MSQWVDKNLDGIFFFLERGVWREKQENVASTQIGFCNNNLLKKSQHKNTQTSLVLSSGKQIGVWGLQMPIQTCTSISWPKKKKKTCISYFTKYANLIPIIDMRISLEDDLISFL